MKPLLLSAAGVVLLGGLSWAMQSSANPSSLIQNPGFEQHNGNALVGYTLDGDVSYQFLGDTHRDASTLGVAMHARGSHGEVSQIVPLPTGQQRGFRFDFRGLPQDGFMIGNNGHLLMRAEFL